MADEHAQLVARVEGRSLCGPDRLGARDTGGRQKEASSAAAPAAPASCVHLEYLRQDGNPQWQEQVGCIGAASGGYALGTALEQTVDGGYVISGGTRDCQFSPICPYLTSQACGLIVKLDAAGNLAWTRIYSSSATETTFWDVKQTGDGGFVAVGTYRDPNGGTGSLILKLDGGGTVQWQTLLVPLARTYAYLEAVQPTRDGGYVAAGQFYPLSSTGTGAGVLAVKLDANGNVAWQRGFNSFDSSGAPTAGEWVSSVIQTAEGRVPRRGCVGQRHPPRNVLPAAPSC